MGYFTLATEDKFFIENKMHAYIKEKGKLCHPTFLAQILGGIASEDIVKTLDGKSWWYQTSSADGFGHAIEVSRKTAQKGAHEPKHRSCIARPYSSSFSKIIKLPKITDRGDNWIQIECSLYAQDAFCESDAKRFEENFQNNNLEKLDGLNYIFDTKKWNDFSKTPKWTEYPRYKDKETGQVGIRIKLYAFVEESFMLLDGKIHKNGDVVWVEEKPVKMALDEKNGDILFVDGIYSGIQMLDGGGYYTGNMSDTLQQHYLDSNFELMILQNLDN